MRKWPVATAPSAASFKCAVYHYEATVIAFWCGRVYVNDPEGAEAHAFSKCEPCLIGRASLQFQPELRCVDTFKL